MTTKKRVFILKAFIIFSFLMLMSSCYHPTQFTTKEEYVEEREWDKEKGFVKNYKASWSVQWEKL